MEYLTDSEIISQYAVKYKRQPGCKVEVNRVPGLPSSIPQTAAERGCGDLNRLPEEVRRMILQCMDFKSAARFSRASRHCAQLVFSEPAYMDVLRHAPEALAGLREMRLLGVHSIASLHAALRSDKCAGCGQFGAFLFPLECERCCWPCSDCNSRCWAITRHAASNSYGIPAEDMAVLPASRMSTSAYLPDLDCSRPLPEVLHWMVSTRAAVALALRVHGSESAVRRFMHRATFDNIQEPYANTKVSFVDSMWRADVAVSQRHDHESAGLRSSSMPNHYYRNSAYLVFPCLRGGGREESKDDAGFWCAGCGFVAVTERRDSNWPSKKEWQWRESFLRERSRASFVEHVRSCSDLAKVLKTFGEEGLENWKQEQLKRPSFQV